MTGRFGIGTMYAVFQVVGTVFVEKHALLVSACLRYSWCNVIWASGFVGIHMLKVFVVQCYLGQWLCWDSHAETRLLYIYITPAGAAGEVILPKVQVAGYS